MLIVIQNIIGLHLLLNLVLAWVVEMTIRQCCHHVKCRWVSHRACLRGWIWKRRFTLWIAYAWVLRWELWGDLRAILVAGTEFRNAETSTMAAKSIAGATSGYRTEASELYRPLPIMTTIMHAMHWSAMHWSSMTPRHMTTIPDIQWNIWARCPASDTHYFFSLLSKLTAVFPHLHVPLLVLWLLVICHLITLIDNGLWLLIVLL